MEVRMPELAAKAQLRSRALAMRGIYFDDPETTPPAELRSGAALPSRSRLGSQGAGRTPASGRALRLHDPCRPVRGAR
jgi:hypothetical protein